MSKSIKPNTYKEDKYIANLDNVGFVSRVAGALKANKLTGDNPKNQEELATLTGNKTSTIKALMYKGKGGENLLNCVANVLKIER